MRSTRLEILLGAGATAALLALTAPAGLDAAGCGVGLALGWGATVLMASARERRGEGVAPADWITLARAVLTAAIGGLVVADRAAPVPAAWPVTLAAVALVLDGVDGRVARRTGTATPLGGRFDGEVDALLILVLSVAAARTDGAWVLLIGLARYAFLVAGWALPWLAAALPYRFWRKVVTAVVGIVLTVALARALPGWAEVAALAGALALIAESFGRDVVWLYRAGAGRRTRRVVRTAAFLGAGALVWAALDLPDRLERITPTAFLAVPAEGLVLVAIALVLPARTRRWVAAVAGLLVGLLVVLKALDVVLYQELDRPFDPVLDWRNLGPGLGVVRDSVGDTATELALVALGAGLVVLIVALTLAAMHVSAVAARHRRPTLASLSALALVWGLAAAMSLDTTPGVPLAGAATARLAVDRIGSVERGLRDQRTFERDLDAADPYSVVPASRLLARLQGKDVLIVFVESYGRVAVQGTDFSTGVDAVLRAQTARLAAAGYGSRSAFLTSSTFGGISWLAHSTLQSGLWIDSPTRYDQLMASSRFNLSAAFHQAGWRTVSDIPSDEFTWPAGESFYRYDRLYDRRNVGYHGPTFSYASMPDQFSLAAFQRLELTAGHAPVMAEIDLVSTHTPWTPLPHLVPWDRLGDGSIFDPQPARGLTPPVAWRDSRTVQRLYGRSVQYTWRALGSWIRRLHDRNLVVIALGDHQPGTMVSGTDASHDVPISIITPDRAVLDRTASWHWQDGLLPSPTATTWPMSAFRDRFFDAFDR